MTKIAAVTAQVKRYKMTTTPKDAEQSAQDRLARAVRNASAASTLHGQAVARRVGLSPVDLECLDLILMGGPASAGAIGRRTGLSSGAVTGLVDRLEALGLVRRSTDPLDRRKVLVGVVPDRLQPIADLYAPMDIAFRDMMSSYDTDLLSRIAEFMERAAALTMARVTELNALQSPAKSTVDHRS